MNATCNQVGARRSVLSRAAIFGLTLGIRGYQFAVRPLLIGSCKFHPTCSEYAAEALQKYGAWRGFGLAVRRMARCHPWSKAGGYDPVP